jgi:hypothetical protein
MVWVLKISCGVCTQLLFLKQMTKEFDLGDLGVGLLHVSTVAYFVDTVLGLLSRFQTDVLSQCNCT